MPVLREINMTKQEKLLDFFRREFLREKEADFALLSRIPSSGLEQRLAHYLSLPGTHRGTLLAN